jgi:DNA-3-methyladenine glycosylase II
MTPIVNPRDIGALGRLDGHFALILERWGPPPNWQRPPGLDSLVRIILEQQVSLASAKAHYEKLVSYIGEPRAERILELRDEEMRDCQISRQKAVYLRALSLAVVEGRIDLEKLGRQKEERIRESLMGIKGIGRWTADIYLLFCLQRKDVLPIGDLAIRKSIYGLWGTKDEVKIMGLSEAWKPLRSLASYFLWHQYLSKGQARS